MVVSKIERKKFVAKNIIHLAVFRKKDSRTVYNMIYKDGKSGTSYMKRFNVTAVTRDKTYNLTSNSPKTKVLYFSSQEVQLLLFFFSQVLQDLSHSLHSSSSSVKYPFLHIHS